MLKMFCRCDNSDVCKTMWMFLMPLNCTLKMFKMVNRMLCVKEVTFLKVEKADSALDVSWVLLILSLLTSGKPNSLPDLGWLLCLGKTNALLLPFRRFQIPGTYPWWQAGRPSYCSSVQPSSHLKVSAW